MAEKRGRPSLGRSTVVNICLEPALRKELKSLAKETNRSVSDYCRYVLNQHVALVKEGESMEATESVCALCENPFSSCSCIE